MVFGQIDADVDLPPIAGLDQAMAYNQDTSPMEAYAASLSWQFAWKHSDLRFGLGTSSVPGAWLMQSTDLSVRLGGKVRREERRMRKGWRRSRDPSGDAPE
ncbi:MAG: hypothetical protein QGG40_13290, partial [Myxococcota bacterium]|jgi:hypothetical protein|nr:hypothetical protein [Myxococcota bacterium]